MAVFSKISNPLRGIARRFKSIWLSLIERTHPTQENMGSKDVTAQEVGASATTLSIALQNKTTSSTVYAYITGRAIDNNNALFLLQADGKTAYYPTSPSSTITPLAQNCAISLGAPGSTVTVTIPHLSSARIYFSVGKTLTFYLNPGPALVEPSVTNPSDPNINTNWDFAEFTWNSAQLFANITYVDFVALPIALTLTNTSGATQHVTGMGPSGLDSVCSQLVAQSASDGSDWKSLVVTNSGKNIRALSPNDGIVTNGALFNNYYQSYINSVWSKYASTNLSIDTQVSFGVVTGKVTNNAFSIGGEVFNKPTAADIFSCSTGPFANPAGSGIRDAIIPRLAAAFNRSTLLTATTSPDPRGASAYYQDPITNHYSRIVHAANTDKRGYAFPYDDVAPSGGSDQAGAVFDGSPQLLTVAVGGN